MQKYTFEMKQTLPNMIYTLLTKAVFINENLYYIGNVMNSFFNTQYTNPPFYSFTKTQGIIWSSDERSASYKLDDTGIIVQYNLTDYLPNTITTSPFIVIAPIPLVQYTSINMIPMVPGKMTTYTCTVTDPALLSDPLT